MKYLILLITLACTLSMQGQQASIAFAEDINEAEEMATTHPQWSKLEYLDNCYTFQYTIDNSQYHAVLSKDDILTIYTDTDFEIATYSVIDHTRYEYGLIIRLTVKGCKGYSYCAILITP